MPQSKSYSFLFAFLMLVVIGLAGSSIWLRTGSNKPEPTWTGTLMGGPANAYGPRISPDGKMLAFQALVDGTSQVAVMNVKSGNWTLLTHDKNSGFVDYATWSRDGTRIYFSRDDRKIYSIPALGGEQRVLLENADYPDELPDRSLIVSRRNPERVEQLYRFRPDTGEIRPLNALIASVNLGFVPAASFRVFPDGGQVVFFGRPAEAGAQASSRLYVLDLHSNGTRPLEQGSYDLSTIFGLAVSPTAKSVLVNVKNGDLHQILSLATEAGRPPQAVLTLTDSSGYIDVASDGSLYVDQVARPMQALRFTESAQPPETMAVVPVANPFTSSVLELSDGRLLLTALFDGRSRLVMAKSNGEFSPFIDTDEETFGPATSIGSDRVAFFFGKPPEQSIAIASIKDGRLIERRKIMAIDTSHSLSSSPDGATLFYTDSGSVWSIPVASGEARKLGPGDDVAFDPHQQNLIVQLNENSGVRLVRMPVSGGATETIPIHADNIRIALPAFLGPNAVRQDGRIVLSAAFKDSWFFGPATLDPASGELRKVPLRYDADFFSFSWNQKNQIIAGAFLLRSSIWRFRPQSSN